MKYLPATLGQSDLNVLKGPYFGGEYAVYLSHVQAVRIATLALTAAAAGVLTDDPATALPAAPTGADVVCVATTPIRSSANVVITLAGMDNSATPVAMNGVATFAPPSWVEDQSPYFQRGIAMDLIPATGGKKFSSLGTLTSVVGGAANMEFQFFQLPDTADWIFVGCTDDVDFNDKARMPKGVDCAMETDAFIKRGKTSEGTLSIGSKFRGFMAGLSRFSGQFVTVMAVGVKDGELTADRVVFTQVGLANDIKLPEGDGNAVIATKAKFKEIMMFAAPYA